MTDRGQYAPGPAGGARVQKAEGEKWTLIMVRELRHPPERVWEALTEPAHLSEWAPFDADRSLAEAGTTVKLSWLAAPAPIETKVTRADAPRLLEYDDTRWELEAIGDGTRLTLWHSIDRRYIAWGASGWHIAFEVLVQALSGIAVARIAGADIMKFDWWRRLRREYAVQFGMETPSTPPKAPQNS